LRYLQQQMDKRRLVETVQQHLAEELATLMQAAKAAHEAATHEESKAEDQHDTRGLEASYLAGSGAARCRTPESTPDVEISPDPGFRRPRRCGLSRRVGRARAWQDAGVLLHCPSRRRPGDPDRWPACAGHYSELSDGRGDHGQESRRYRRNRDAELHANLPRGFDQVERVRNEAFGLIRKP